MTPGLGIKPGTHWWKASALTTTPTLLPYANPAPHFQTPSKNRVENTNIREFLRKFNVTSYESDEAVHE